MKFQTPHLSGIIFNHMKLPVLAVIGRPNVGKSTLVNRILGQRESIIEDQPGVTRDRIIYDASWNGYDFKLMDTGGWESKVEGLDKVVADAAAFAIDIADVILFVVDSRVGGVDTDLQIAKMIRKSKKPVLLVANKVDGANQEMNALELWNMGFGEPILVSALHGRGSGDMLDAAVNLLKKHSDSDGHMEESKNFIPSVALVGRPNVGKSSLLNKIANQNRVVVSEISGTTRDPVDELIEFGGRSWNFIDTAGIRKKASSSSGVEYYALLRTQAAIIKSDLVLCLIDVTENISDQDMKILNMVVEAGKSLVIVFNKWDTLAEKYDTDGRRELLEREVEQDLGFVAWAPRVNISAKTGWHKDRLVKAMDLSLNSWNTRIPTATLNAFIGRLISEFPHPIRSGKQPRILFASQVSVAPPKFLLFSSGFIEHQYRRFIERKIREEYNFEGSPIEISVKVREKRKNI